MENQGMLMTTKGNQTEREKDESSAWRTDGDKKDEDGDRWREMKVMRTKRVLRRIQN